MLFSGKRRSLLNRERPPLDRTMTLSDRKWVLSVHQRVLAGSLSASLDNTRPSQSEEVPFIQKEGLSLPGRANCRHQRAYCQHQRAILRSRQGLFRPTQGPLKPNEGPLRPKEGLFKQTRPLSCRRRASRTNTRPSQGEGRSFYTERFPSQASRGPS